MRLRIFGVLAALLVAARAATAQVGQTTQIITGRVRGPDSAALAGAQYRLRVTFIGMAPATLTLTQQPDDDRLIAAVRMARAAVQLSAVQIRANASRNGGPPPSTRGLQRAQYSAGAHRAHAGWAGRPRCDCCSVAGNRSRRRDGLDARVIFGLGTAGKPEQHGRVRAGDLFRRHRRNQDVQRLVRRLEILGARLDAALSDRYEPAGRAVERRSRDLAARE